MFELTRHIGALHQVTHINQVNGAAFLNTAEIQITVKNQWFRLTNPPLFA